MEKGVASIDVVAEQGFPAQVISLGTESGSDSVRVCYCTNATAFDTSAFKEALVPVTALRESGVVPQRGAKFLYFPASARVSQDIPVEKLAWYGAIHRWLDSD